jgi:hypothetical protein
METMELDYHSPPSGPKRRHSEAESNQSEAGRGIILLKYHISFFVEVACVKTAAYESE